MLPDPSGTHTTIDATKTALNFFKGIIDNKFMPKSVWLSNDVKDASEPARPRQLRLTNVTGPSRPYGRGVVFCVTPEAPDCMATMSGTES